MIYVDTSALAKLVAAEPETESLQTYFRQNVMVPTASSELTLVELRRATLRWGREAADSAEDLLARIDTHPVTRDVIARASSMEPVALRALDALHIATALELRATAVVTYDQRMMQACLANALDPIAPDGT